MPVCKAEAHRALELLEDYFEHLDDNSERELKAAVERVIKIFKSRLFQALLDIQEFYEATLMDESKSRNIKTREAIEMAARWEATNRPFGTGRETATAAVPPAAMAPATVLKPVLTGKMKEEFLQKLDTMPQVKAAANSGSNSAVVDSGAAAAGTSRSLSSLTHSEPAAPTAAAAAASSGATKTRTLQRSADQLYEFDQITLERGSYGLGFSIAGGIDNPHVVGDTGVYITKLIAGGAAALDKRLRVNDVILKVNDVVVINVPHRVAVEALKEAGNRVTLSIKRRVGTLQTNHVALLEVELKKGSKGLGFTIAGGIGNQHIPGDNGIYVTKILDGGAAAVDGRIDVGDLLVSVKNHPDGEFVMDNCTHEEAVGALKKCRGSVVLVVSKATEASHPASPTLGQMNPLPANSFLSRRSVSDEDLRGPRDVLLHKSPAGLGFNIVGGEDGEGIFISFILAGGPADASGHVRRGDKIVAVNGVDLSGATHEDAAVALKNAGNAVTLRLMYCPTEYEAFETKIHSIKNQVMSGSMLRMSEKKSLFIRALFDYDPSADEGVPSRGLAFFFGDIIHVVNASDDDWWQARKIDNQGNELSIGIIPSKMRWERKQKARDRNIKWDSNSLGRDKKQGSLSSRLGIFNSREGNGSLEGANSSPGKDTDSSGPAAVLSYELVQQVEIDYTRPVIVLGPLKDRINDNLITEFPEKFTSCVPHTTRPKREAEVNGKDYHFVESREQMERDIQNHKFIEAGQYKGNLYGTSIASVKEVAEAGKHCILDVSGNAIKRLQSARLFPIAIFVRPTSAAFVQSVSTSSVDKMSEEEAEKAMVKAAKLEHDFLPYFTAVVAGEKSFAKVFDAVKSLIRVHSTSKIWVPASEMF